MLRCTVVSSCLTFALGGDLGQKVGAVGALTPVRDATLFTGLDAGPLIEAMREDSAAFGLRLPTPIVASLADAARTGTLRQWHSERLFHASEVVAGRLPDGAAAVLADVHEAALLPDVQRVARDPLLLATVTGYLGYAPIGCDPRILYSFAADYDEDERRAVG